MSRRITPSTLDDIRTLHACCVPHAAIAGKLRLLVRVIRELVSSQWAPATVSGADAFNRSDRRTEHKNG